MAVHSLYVHLVATLGQFTPNIAAARAQLEGLERAVGDGTTKRAKALDKLGKGALVAGGAVAVGMGMAVKAAVEWESAWAGVLKTATADENTLAGRMQLDKLEKDLRGLASTLPTTHAEIAAVAEAAGQLGVATPDVARFTKTMVDLGVSTNLSAEDAATGLARMMNVMQTAPEDVDRMGAALVALGNAGASTEAEILHMATRIAGAGATVGASEADILALSNALSSMGVQAELGSGVMTRTLLELETAASSGASGLEDYAKVAGVSAQEFAEAWERDPVRALNMFTTGVGRLQESGGNAVKALEDVGAAGTLDKQVLLALASSGDLLTRSLDLGARSWEENAALAEEAGKRYDTTESRMKIAKNTLSDFAIDLGTVLLPGLARAAEGVADLGNFLRGLPDPVKQALALLATGGAAFALLGGAALVMIPKIAAAKGALVELGIVSATTTGQVSRLSTALKVVGAASVIGTLAMVGYMAADAFAKAGPPVEGMTRSLLEFAETGRVAGPLAQVLGKDLGNLAETIERATSNRAGATLKWLAFLDDDHMINIKTARNELDSLDKALAGLVSSGQGEKAAAMYQQIAVAAHEQGVEQAELRKITEEYHAAQAAAREEQQAAKDAAYEEAEAIGGVTSALSTGYESLGAYAAAQGLMEEETKALVKQIEAWGESLAEFVNPLGAYTELLARKTEAENEQAQAHEEALGKEGDTWEQYVGDVSVSVDEYLAELERMVRDQEEWAGNMTRLAGRVSTSTLDELARMGPEGAPLVAKLVDASDAELARMDDLFGRRTKEAVDGQAEQWRLWGALAPQLTAKIGKNAVDALGVELAKGTTTVAQIAAKYGVSLAAGVNPVIVASGGRKIVVGAPNDGRTRGGGPQEYADGGRVTGPGSGTSDSIPAYLSNGEFVIRAAAVQSYGQEFLEAINESRFARGGLVRPLKLAAGGLALPPKPGNSSPPVSTAATAVMQRAYEAASAKLAASRASGSVATDSELASNAVALKRLVLGQVGPMTVGGWGTRPNPTEHDDMIGGRKASRALDFMTTNLALGNKVAAIAETFPGTNYLIWQRQIWKPGQAHRPYRGRSPHTDHVHASVFSRGGPVGRPVRRAAGGPVGRATAARPAPVPVTRGGSLVAATRGMTDVAAIRALVEAWERYNEQLGEAARRRELVASHGEARTEYAAAQAVTARTRAELAKLSTTKAQVAAQTALETAERRLRQAKTPAARENAQAAIRTAQARVAASRTEAQAKAQAKLVDALRDEHEARERYSGAIGDLREYDRAAARDKEAAAVERLVAKLEREAEVREELGRIRDERLGDLNGLLDQVDRVRDQEAEALEDYNERVSELAQERADAERRMQQGTAEAGQRLAEQQAELLAGRSRQLEQWARLDEQVAVGWGNTVDQLLSSATRQAAQFDEWQSELAAARARGVSESVIASLGLDEGPAALGQLRQFRGATTAQIEQLNAALEKRTKAAQQQARAEAAANLGQLGADLLAAQDTYTASVMALEEEFREAQANIDRELADAQADLKRRQADLATELGNIGRTQGRSYADALAAGLESGLPGVVAAAQALAYAAKGAAAVGAAPPPAGGGVTAPTGANAKAAMIGGVYTDLASGRPAYVGPNGEPGYGDAQKVNGMNSYRMPDGRTAWYWRVPGRTYDAGGVLAPGLTLAHNATGQNEYVLTQRQLGEVAMRGSGGGGGGTTEVRVFIGDRELTDLVRVTVDGTLTDRRSAAAIAGRR